MTPAELLQELEPLTHAQRMRRMVDVGRRAAAEPEVAATLAALEAGGFYERYLALQACYGSRDGAYASQALADPSRIIRGLAVGLIALLGDDAQARAALDAGGPAERQRLLRRLHRRGRQAPIDAFLATLAARNDPELPRVLAWGSPAVTGRHLDTALEHGGQSAIMRLARRHPTLLASALAARAATADDGDRRLLGEARMALPVLGKLAPDAALALVRALTPLAAPGALPVQSALDRRPVEAVDLLLASDDLSTTGAIGSYFRRPLDFRRAARHLDAARLIALVQRRWLSGGAAGLDWLRHLPPERRRAVYAACGLGWRDVDGALPAVVLALLPADVREAEARRHLTLDALSTRVEERLAYVTFLPWEEARAAAAEALADAEPTRRAVALSALIQACRFQRDRLPDLLALLGGRLREPDPVRQAVMTELAALPPGAWRAAHLEMLGTLVRAALDAADLSLMTAMAAERLIVRLLPLQTDCAVPWLVTLLRERGQLGEGRLETRLTDADAQRLAPALLPLLQVWETRQREQQIVGLITALGRRIRVLPAVVELAERMLIATHQAWVADALLGALDRWQPARRDALLPSLLAADPTWITRAGVLAWLHAHRQDLLTPFLRPAALDGRFGPVRSEWVLPLRQGFVRWTPTQQTSFAGALADVAADAERETPAVLDAIEQLAALPAAPPDALVALAADSRLPVRDAALRALGRLDADQGVPTLLAALDDGRAGVAIYALRRALLRMPEARALTLLRAVSLERVTVAKEVARLLGDLRSNEAYQALLALDERDLHRDVRAALLRALWGHLDREATWPILERAAAAPEPAFAAVLARTPADDLAPTATRRLVGLLVRLLAHPTPEIRLEVMQRCAELPLPDPDAVLLPPLLIALAALAPDEQAAAARAVFALAGASDAPGVGTAVARLLLERRMLWTTVELLLGALHSRREALREPARALLSALARDPLTAELQVRIGLNALPPAELVALLTGLASRDELHADALSWLMQALERPMVWPPPEALVALEAALAAQPDPRLRRLALAALVGQAQPPNGWDDARRGRLVAYEADPASLVAAPAAFAFTREWSFHNLRLASRSRARRRR